MVETTVEDAKDRDSKSKHIITANKRLGDDLVPPGIQRITNCPTRSI
jgi:hypothetical protein